LNWGMQNSVCCTCWWRIPERFSAGKRLLDSDQPAGCERIRRSIDSLIRPLARKLGDDARNRNSFVPCGAMATSLRPTSPYLPLITTLGLTDDTVEHHAGGRHSGAHLIGGLSPESKRRRRSAFRWTKSRLSTRRSRRRTPCRLRVCAIARNCSIASNTRIRFFLRRENPLAHLKATTRETNLERQLQRARGMA
jgi:hypothetical protein